MVSIGDGFALVRDALYFPIHAPVHIADLCLVIAGQVTDIIISIVIRTLCRAKLGGFAIPMPVVQLIIRQLALIIPVIAISQAIGHRAGISRSQQAQYIAIAIVTEIFSIGSVDVAVVPGADGAMLPQFFQPVQLVIMIGITHRVIMVDIPDSIGAVLNLGLNNLLKLDYAFSVSDIEHQRLIIKTLFPELLTIKNRLL